MIETGMYRVQNFPAITSQTSESRTNAAKLPWPLQNNIGRFMFVW